MNVRSRWLDWEPQTRIFSKCPKEAPTKPTETTASGFVGSLQNLQNRGGETFVGFVGPSLGQIQKIEWEPDPADLAQATALLNQAGVRIVRLETGYAIGLWSDLDAPAIRAALQVVGLSELCVLYLDGPGVPLPYKLRRVAGDPVSDLVRREMELSQEPWEVRNRMLRRLVPWLPAEAKTSRTTDPRTGIRPIREWGASCGRGFVSDARFGPNQPVIQRTNRKTTRTWRSLNER